MKTVLRAGMCAVFFPEKQHESRVKPIAKNHLNGLSSSLEFVLSLLLHFMLTQYVIFTKLHLDQANECQLKIWIDEKLNKRVNEKKLDI